MLAGTLADPIEENLDIIESHLSASLNIPTLIYVKTVNCHKPHVWAKSLGPDIRAQCLVFLAFFGVLTITVEIFMVDENFCQIN